MKRFVGFLLLSVALAGLAVAPAFAQGPLKIIAPPPPPAEKAPALEFVTPGQPAQLTRPREQDFYPEQIKSRHDPAFIVPFTATIPSRPVASNQGQYHPRLDMITSGVREVASRTHV